MENVKYEAFVQVQRRAWGLICSVNDELERKVRKTVKLSIYSKISDSLEDQIHSQINRGRI